MIEIIVRKPSLSPTLKWQGVSLAPTGGPNIIGSKTGFLLSPNMPKLQHEIEAYTRQYFMKDNNMKNLPDKWRSINADYIETLHPIYKTK